MQNRPLELEEIKRGIYNGILRDGQFLEFKYFLGPINYEAIVKNLVGFANSGGGSVIIGASDNSFGKGMNIIGFPIKEKEHFEDQIRKYIDQRVKNLDDITFHTIQIRD